MQCQLMSGKLVNDPACHEEEEGGGEEEGGCSCKWGHSGQNRITEILPCQITLTIEVIL